MMVFRFGLLLLMLLGSISLAALEVEFSMNEEKFDAAVVALDKFFEINGYYHTTNKAVRLFHWKDRNFITSDKRKIEVTDKTILQKEMEYINRETQRFASDELQVGWAGSGIYTAKDPYESESYGYKLIEFVFLKGTNYFSLPNDVYTTFDLDEATKSILSKANCIYYTDNLHYGDLIAARGTCNKIMLQVMKKRDVQFISYDWAGHGDKGFFKDVLTKSQDPKCTDDESAYLIIATNQMQSFKLYQGITADQYFEQYKNDPQAVKLWMQSLIHCQ